MEPCRNLNFQVHLAFTAQRWTSLQLADTKEAWRCVQPVDWPSGGHSSHQSGKTRRTTSPAHNYNHSLDMKVFAMLGVFEAVVPIIAGGVFTKLYNATAELDYPWHASFYYGTIGVITIGTMT